MEATTPFDNAYGIAYDEGDISLERVAYTHVKSSNDVNHIVLDGENIFSIAHMYYGDSGMWGLIADVNGLGNVAEELLPGLQILIPHGRK